jgi:hypothetical protein
MGAVLHKSWTLIGLFFLVLVTAAAADDAVSAFLVVVPVVSWYQFGYILLFIYLFTGL